MKKLTTRILAGAMAAVFMLTSVSTTSVTSYADESVNTQVESQVETVTGGQNDLTVDAQLINEESDKSLATDGQTTDGQTTDDDDEEETEDTSKDDDDEEINESLVVAITTGAADDQGQPIYTALTGETQKAVIYAYNDNANATAMAQVRVYVTEPDYARNIKHVTLTNTDALELTAMAGNEALTVTAQYNRVSDDVAYYEFALPAGASISMNIDMLTETGYDKDITAAVTAQYRIADKEGNFPDSWTTADASTELTWTGSWEWKDFSKTVNVSSIGYTDGQFNTDYIEYTFAVTNANTGSHGVIYSDRLTVSDTLTLPEGIELPDGATADADNGKVVTSDGKTIYELTGYSANGGVVNSITVDTANNKISYSLTYTNPQMTEVAWNPLSTFKTRLYLANLSVVSSATDMGQILNSAAVKAESVVSGKDDQGADTRDTYEGAQATAVSVSSEGELGISKVITSITDAEVPSNTYTYDSAPKAKDADGNETDYPEVKGNYTIAYKIVVTNTASYTQKAEFTDTMHKALVMDKSSLKLTTDEAGTKPISSSDYTMTTSIDDDGNTVYTFVLKKVPASTPGTDGAASREQYT